MAEDRDPCPRCGSSLDASETEGLCAKCMVLQMLAPAAISDLANESEGESVLETVGGYEVLGKIASGGMGAVYRARQPGLDRTVALKLIIEGRLAGDLEVERFLLEARSAGELDHPNIVPVYEVGEDRGQPFFSMRLVEGGNLTDWLDELHAPKEGRDFREGQAMAVRMLVKIARAVEYAHSRGILHRDLKPANVLVDERGEPQITDFGLAKRMNADSNLTLSGQVLGSPSFMSPEQGSGAEATPASDVYSLGVILYQMLTLKVPFYGESPLEIVRRAAEEAPKPPRRIKPAIDRELEIVCLKCLEKSPQDRYASAAAFADDLSRWLAGEPVLARPISRLTRGLRWCRRHPARVAAVLVAMALAAFGAFKMHQRNAEDEIVRTDRYVRGIGFAFAGIREGDYLEAEKQLTAVTGFVEKPLPLEWRLLNSASRLPVIAQGKIPLDGINNVMVVNHQPLTFVVTNDRGEMVAWNVDDARIVNRIRINDVDSPLPRYSGGGKSVLTRGSDGSLVIKGGGQSRTLPPSDDIRFIATGGRAFASSSGKRGDSVRGSYVDDGVENSLPAARLTLTQDIEALAIAPSRFLAIAYPGYVQIFDYKKDRYVAVDIQHVFGPATAMEFSGNGNRLATGAADGSARLWNPGKATQDGAALSVGDSPLTALAFIEPDKNEPSQQLVAIAADGTFKVWDLLKDPAKNPLRAIYQPGVTWPFALSEDGLLVVATMTGGTGIGALERTNLSALRNAPIEGEILALAVSGGGLYRACMRSRDGLKIVTFDTRLDPIAEIPLELALGDTGLDRVVFVPEKERLVVLSGNALWLIDVETGRVSREISGVNGGGAILAASRDHVVIASETFGAICMDLERGVAQALEVVAKVYSAAIRNDGKELVIGAAGELHLFSRSGRAWKRRNSITGLAEGRVACAFSGDGRTLIVSNAEAKSLAFHLAATGEKMFHVQTEKWTHVVCTDRSDMIVAAGPTGLVFIPVPR